MNEKRTKFLKLYADIPDSLRGDIIAVIENKTYTWNSAFIEINDDTPLGKKILKALEEVKIL